MTIDKQNENEGNDSESHHYVFGDMKIEHIYIITIATGVVTVLCISAFTWYLCKICRNASGSEPVAPAPYFSQTHVRQESEMEFKKKKDASLTVTCLASDITALDATQGLQNMTGLQDMTHMNVNSNPEVEPQSDAITNDNPQSIQRVNSNQNNIPVSFLRVEKAAAKA